MRILYLARSWGGHDARCVHAWRSAGVETVALVEDGSAPGQERPEEPFEKSIADAVATSHPDVIHAGSLTDVAWAAAHVWPGPLIATSWGFDLMKEVDESPLHHQRAQHVLRRADVVLVDNNAPARRAVALGTDPHSLVHLPWGVDRAIAFSAGAWGRAARGRSNLAWLAASWRR